MIINTRGGSCAALATDRGEGTVYAIYSTINTGVGQESGSGSPLIYSTGNITAVYCNGTSYVSQIGCIEGKNSITLLGCNLTGYAKGNRESNGEYVDLGGFFIYQSMSGDADTGTATLNATDTVLTIASDSNYYTTAPMFHITNTASIINLDNCTLNYGSGILLNISGQDQWGTSGSNGGDLEFTSINENIEGDIIVDSISSMNFTMESTNYTGSINPSGSYGTTSVVVDSNSTWTLTNDSYVTDLIKSGTINYNSNSLYVDGEEYTSSNPYNETSTQTTEITNYTTLNALIDSVEDGTVITLNNSITRDESETFIYITKNITINGNGYVIDANGDFIQSGKVVFKLNGNTLKDSSGNVLYATVSDGIATINYTIPDNYSAKDYNIIAVFGGDYYERVETSATLTLEKKDVSISIDSTSTSNNKTTIKATIVDEMVTY